MTQPLIRSEVYAARTERLGEVRVRLPAVLRWLVVLLVAAAVSLLLLLCFGSYTRRVSVVGEIVPAAGLLRVEAPQ